MGAFRAERTVKIVRLELIELGKMGAFRTRDSEKVGDFLIEQMILIELKK